MTEEVDEMPVRAQEAAQPAGSEPVLEGSAEASAAPAEETVTPDASDAPPADSGAPDVAEKQSAEALPSGLPAGAAGTAPAEAAGAAAPAGDRTAEGLAEVGKGLEALSQGLAESNYLARAREQIIDRLHTENEKLRAGVLEQAMGPVLRDLMRLYDDLARTAEAYASREPREAESTVRDWASYRDVVEDILYRQGVEPVETAPGDPFDPRLHRAVGPEDTPERTLEKAVARVVRPGFQSGSRILRPAEVRVFRYAAPQGPVEPVEEHQQKEERS